MEIVYTLEDFTTTEKEHNNTEEKHTLLRSPNSLPRQGYGEQVEGQVKKTETIKQQQHAFAPTVDKIKREDHQRMFQQGRSLMHSSS